MTFRKGYTEMAFKEDMKELQSVGSADADSESI